MSTEQRSGVERRSACGLSTATAQAGQHASLTIVDGLGRIAPRSFLQTLLDAQPQQAMLVDAKHRIVMANQHQAVEVGADVDSCAGQYCPKQVHGLDAPAPGCPLEAAVGGGRSTVDREIHDRETGRWTRVVVAPTGFRTAAGEAVFLHLACDVTSDKTASAVSERARRQADEALRRNFDTQRVIAAILRLSAEDVSLDALLSQALELLVTIDWLCLEGRGCILLVDDSGERLTLAASRGFTELQRQTCARVELGQCLCGKAAERGQVVFANHVDEDHDTHVGGVSDHGHYCVPIRYHGRTLGVLNTYLAAGHSRSQAEERFLCTVADTLAGVLVRRRSEDQLRRSQKMDAIGRLAAGVAHDFNNLLAVMLSCTDYFRGEVQADAALQETIDDMELATRRAAALTRQLLAFGRKELSRPEPLDLAAVVGGIESLLRRTLGEDVELILRLTAAPDRVFADCGLLEQVLLNLVVNARHAMPEGGTLTISTSARECSGGEAAALELEPGAYVTVSVQDTGEGMTPAVIDRIFEPFFTTKESGRGIGLGLATVYGIVKQARGAISVSSRVGEGSVFTIYLSAHTGPTLASTASIRPVAARGGGETVLLVEDDSLLRVAAERLLVQAGFHVLNAADAESAIDIAAAAREPIDLLLTDVMMPGMNGRALSRILSRARPKMRTLFMSGHSEDIISRHGVLDPGVHLLVKPFDEAQLLSSISEVLATEPDALGARGDS